MKNNPLTYANFIGLLALGAGLFFLRGPGASSPSETRGPWLGSLEQAAAPEAQPEAFSAELESLRARVNELEARLAERGAPSAFGAVKAAASKKPTPAALPDGAEAEAGEEAPIKDRSPVRRSELAALVKAELEAELQARQKRQEEERAAQQARQRQGKPKRTVAELGRELNLAPEQESGLRNALNGMTREAMQILFQAEGEKGLREVKEQLRLAQFDPALKEQLRQKVTLNYTLHGAEISALYIKFDSNLRQIVEPEQLKTIYQYDVKPADPEFPDLQQFFWGQQGEGDGDQAER